MHRGFFKYACVMLICHSREGGNPDMMNRSLDQIQHEHTGQKTVVGV